MPRFFKRVSKKRGLPPGSIIHIGKQKIQKEKITLTVIDYDHQYYEEKSIEDIDALLAYKNKKTVKWININGIYDVETIERVGKIFDLHALQLEDIVNTNQRPKIEEYDGNLFIVLKMLSYNESKREITAEQVSFVCGENFVISFQECEGDVFDSIRNRIKNYKGKIRKQGADYLAYALLDSIIDNYFVVLEKMGDAIESLEEELISNPSQKTLHKIHYIKKELLFLRKVCWPVREVINMMSKIEPPLISEGVEFYLRDLYDHSVQIIDTVETFRDMVSGMLDTYISQVSNKMNEVMKVLTIIATIFIPITFIAGVYGMNFEYMPELKWRFGYLGVWILMGTIIVAMLVFFKKKKWL